MQTQQRTFSKYYTLFNPNALTGVPVYNVPQTSLRQCLWKVNNVKFILTLHRKGNHLKHCDVVKGRDTAGVPAGLVMMTSATRCSLCALRSSIYILFLTRGRYNKTPNKNWPIYFTNANDRGLRGQFHTDVFSILLKSFFNFCTLEVTLEENTLRKLKG